MSVLVFSILMQWCLAFSSLPLRAASLSFATQAQGSGFKVREANAYAPDLYADNLDFTATLKSLPGAGKKESYWELSYQIFFVPEDRYFETVKRLPRGGANPTPEDFSGRILLAEGHKKKTGLGTLKERTIVLSGVRFKEKIPDAQRTKFAYLLTGYAVKIFDAELNTTVYHSGIFLSEPFESSADDQRRPIARKAIYLNFGVNPDGTLNRSQLSPKSSNTSQH